jgi:hypothetical protein
MSGKDRMPMTSPSTMSESPPSEPADQPNAGFHKHRPSAGCISATATCCSRFGEGTTNYSILSEALMEPQSERWLYVRANL